MPEGTYGPYSTRTANTLDPYVNSDLDSTGAGTIYGSTGTGMPGKQAGNIPKGTYGPYSTYTTNVMDRRVDSNRDRRDSTDMTIGMGGGRAGPYSSSIMNKLDPRVDSQTGTSMGNAGISTGTAGRERTRGTGEYY